MGRSWLQFAVQSKRWYGWSTLYEDTSVARCKEYIEQLKRITNIEFVKL